MIVFVDEDENQTWPWRAELQVRGYEVCYIRTADDAFGHLIEADLDVIDLVIVDLMLAVSSAEQSRFDVRNTDLYHETGLVLLQDLADQRPQLVPRCMLLTNATGSRLVRAELRTRELGARLVRKPSIHSPHDFGEMVRAFIEENS